MNDFVLLYEELSDATSALDKVELMRAYFAAAPPSDVGWAIHILSGGKLERAVSAALLREWVSEYSGIPQWLVEESYQIVGDLAETAALLVAKPQSGAPVVLEMWIDLVRSLKLQMVEDRKREVFRVWGSLPPQACLVFNKLVTGGLRIHVARGLVIKALAKAVGADEAIVAHRLVGLSNPVAVTLHSFRLEQHEAEQSLAPYPFYQAYSLEGGVEALGDPREWLAEWKWDGIRSQTVVRHGKLAIWSRGEELVTESFPELAKLVELLPNGTVIDGEIVAQRDGTPAPFGLLQPRLDRKRVTKKHVEEFPVAIVAYDLLEVDGIDIRNRSLADRRAALKMLIKSIEDPLVPLSLSGPIAFQKWPELTEARRSSRERSAEGLILKRLDSSYSVGRQSGEWWKWEVAPHTCHGVLMYAEKGNGKRPDLFTDYTFGVWRGDDLVPFAKAFSGLTDKEIREVDSYIKSHTREKFGPVRSVDPELVFEIAFESVQLSSRHKSGISVRSPRILRWRRGKPAHEAGELSTLLELAVGGSSARDLIT